MDQVVIIGGGIAGSSLAYHLRAAPMDVTLLEKNSIGAGTTGGSVGAFAWWRADTAEDGRLMQDAWEFYRPLIDDGTIGFREVGYLELFEQTSSRETLAARAEQFEADGYRTEVLDPEGVPAHNINPDAAPGGAVWLPDIGRLDPGDVVQVLAKQAADADVTVETGVEVTDVLVENGRVAGVDTTEGRFEADVVINATGMWANQVNGMAGLSFPLKHVQGPIVVLETDADYPLPITVFENGQYFTGDVPATYLAGRSPSEAKDGNGFESWTTVDPDGAHAVDEEFRMAVALKAADAIPFLADAEIANSWLCIRCFTPDHLPIAGQTSVEGFYVMHGFSGIGITLSPAVARLVAADIRGDDAGDLLEYLTPSRFD